MEEEKKLCKPSFVTDKANQWVLEQFCFARPGGPLTNANVRFEDLGERITVVVYDRNVMECDFEFVKNLGQGTYGAVKLYHDYINHVSVAVKFTQTNDESKVTDIVNQSNCRVVRMKNVQLPPGTKLFGFIYAYLMELADGSYFTLLHELNKTSLPVTPHLVQNVLFDFEQIRQQLLCLYAIDESFIYLDLKDGNVLYKCENPLKPNQYSVFLGDLGSIVGKPRAGGTFYATTYPPYELVSVSGSVLVPLDVTEQQVYGYFSWQMGIMLLKLAYALDRNQKRPPWVFSKDSVLDILRTKLYYSNIKFLSSDEMHHLANRLHAYIRHILQLPPENCKYFALDLSKRTSIEVRLVDQAPSVPPKSSKDTREFESKLNAFYERFTRAGLAIPDELQLQHLQEARPSQLYFKEHGAGLGSKRAAAVVAEAKQEAAAPLGAVAPVGAVALPVAEVKQDPLAFLADVALNVPPPPLVAVAAAAAPQLPQVPQLPQLPAAPDVVRRLPLKKRQRYVLGAAEPAQKRCR